MGNHAGQWAWRAACEPDGICRASHAHAHWHPGLGGAEERSQHRNRKLALARLGQTVADVDAMQHGDAGKNRWRAHQEVKRGNPVRVYREDGE